MLWDDLLSTLADPAVTDLIVNGDGSIWVDRGDVTEPANA